MTFTSYLLLILLNFILHGFLNYHLHHCYILPLTEPKGRYLSPSPSPEPHHPDIPGTSTSRFGTRVPGTTLDSAAYQVPMKVRRIFKNGWNEHVPLTVLTDKYCAKEAEDGEGTTESLLRFQDGVWTSVNKSLPNKGEIQLSFDEWFQAWNRLLQLIKQYFKYPEYLMWHRHYLRILEDDTRSEDWALWKAYDITIRRRAIIDKEFDPSKMQEKIWKQLSRRQDKLLIMSTIKSSSSNLSSNHRNSRSTPYTRHTDTNDTADSRNQTNRFRNNQNSKIDQGYRCFVCGSVYHPPTKCFARFLFNTKTPVFLSKPSSSGTRHDADGNIYCYSWNGQAQRCSNPDTCTKRHACTLCGTEKHNAQCCHAL